MIQLLCKVKNNELELNFRACVFQVKDLLWNNDSTVLAVWLEDMTAGEDKQVNTYSKLYDLIVILKKIIILITKFLNHPSWSSFCSPAVGGGELPLVPQAESGLRPRRPEGSGLRLLGPWAPPTAPHHHTRPEQHHLRLGLDDGEEPWAGRHRQRQCGGDRWRWEPVGGEDVASVGWSQTLFIYFFLTPDKVLVTTFRRCVVPPPMCSFELHLPSPVNHVTFLCQPQRTNELAALTSDGQVSIYSQGGSFSVTANMRRDE